MNMIQRPARHVAHAALVALFMTGCREGVAPFTPVDRETGGPAYALTFGRGNDADPRWSPAGDTLFYHTNVFWPVPSTGVLLAIPAAGGAATQVFPFVQTTAGTRPLATPVPSPSGDRVAYMDLMSIDVPDGSCSRADGVSEPTCSAMQPLLDSAVLRVRPVGQQGAVTQDPALPVRFAGTDAARRLASAGQWFEQLFPFQEAHRTEAAMLFRPSWAPDGQRIAYSDGLSIRVWTVGDAQSAVIPGTGDGVSAAWSPDGDWIAFTAMPRPDSIEYTCLCGERQAFVTLYGTGERTLVLVRPDGSERIEIGAGEDAAWSPDGQFIYVRRDNAIVRIPRAGGEGVQVAHTEGGRAPAVSPDGRLLALSRSKTQPTPDYDIWVVTLEQ